VVYFGKIFVSPRSSSAIFSFEIVKMLESFNLVLLRAEKLSAERNDLRGPNEES